MGGAGISCWEKITCVAGRNEIEQIENAATENYRLVGRGPFAACDCLPACATLADTNPTRQRGTERIPRLRVGLVLRPRVRPGTERTRG